MTDEQQQIIDLELQLAEIKQRNAKVEADKAWEASFTRIGTICVITYCVAAIFLYVIGVRRFWIDALVPVIGFYLSTRSLPAVKRWWIKRNINAQW